MKNNESHASIYVFWAVSLVTLLFSSSFLKHTLSAIFTSLALAYLFNPLLKYLEARGFSRWLSLVLLYGIVCLGCFVASFIVIPYIGYQTDLFSQSLPGYLKSLRTAIESWKDELSLYYSQEDLDWGSESALDFLNQLISELPGKGYERVKGLGFALFDLALAPVLVFFLLSYKESAKAFVIGMLPGSRQAALKATGNRINRTLEKFLYAMFIDAFLVGLLCSTVLYSMDIEFAILNGMLAGLSTIVPFLGATLSVIPPILIGYLKTGDLMLIPKICGSYFLIHVVIEGNLIKPLLMKGALQLNPLAVIFSIMALGEIMGFWGVMLGVPITAVLKICSEEIHSIAIGDGGNNP